MSMKTPAPLHHRTTLKSAAAIVLATSLAMIAPTLTPGRAAAATPTPPNASAAPHPGCLTPAPQDAGDSELHTLTSGGIERSYQLHLPEDYSPHRTWPLVLAYHGRGNTGAGTEAFSGLDELPAIIAYPNGVVGSGDGERQAWEGAPYSASGVDDVAFTSDLLDTLESTVCVDNRRVYATGKSNGGGFTAILACEMSGRITAIAPVAAAFYDTGRAPCEPSRAVPVIEFHGTGDTTIPYDGVPDRGLPAIRDWLGGWADRNACHTGPSSWMMAEDSIVSQWSGCKRGAQVRHVAITGGGHTWPGADSYSGGGYTTQNIEASEVMWDFFRTRRLH